MTAEEQTQSADQFLLILDVDRELAEEEAVTRLSGRVRRRHVKRLSEFGYARPAGRVDRDALDWPTLMRSVRELVIWTNGLRQVDDHPVEVYVCGLAPLSVFFALGLELDSRTCTVISINQRRGESGTWDVVRLVGAPGEFFTTLPCSNQAASDATGCVATLVSSQLPTVPNASLREFVKSFGADVAGIAPIVTSSKRILDATTIAPAMHQLTEAFSTIPSLWPYRSSLAVTLAGPASLALAAGLAVNPHQYTGAGARIVLGEYVGGQYRYVAEIPEARGGEVSIPRDSESEKRQLEALSHFRVGISELQANLSAASIQFPFGFGLDKDTETRLAASTEQTIRHLTVSAELGETSFELRFLQKKLLVGRGLLEALHGLSSDVLSILGKLFLLHEVVHDYQGLASHNYSGIGRAGVVLEDVDFWADAFAIRVAFEHARATEDTRSPAEILTTLIGAHVEAMRAFDRMEQASDSLTVMPERRLRRYLIWYLQLARAKVVHNDEHARALLNDRLFVELSPLRGRLDARYDKLVLESTQNTVLTVSLGARLERIPALPENFDPRALVDSVRSFDTPAVSNAMDYVVAQAREKLAPWSKPPNPSPVRERGHR